MSYIFNGTDQWFGGGASRTVLPISGACWFKTSDTTVQQVLYWFGRTAFHPKCYLIYRASTANDPVGFVHATTSTGEAAITPGITDTNWHHLGFVAASLSSRYVYLDGVASAEQTTLVVDNPIDTESIGAYQNSASNLTKGSLAEFAVWSTSLNADHFAALAKGVSPKHILPQGLVQYRRFIRDPNDIRGGLTLTQNGTPTVSDHPRIYA